MVLNPLEGYYRPLSVETISDIMETAIREQVDGLLTGGTEPGSDVRDLALLHQIRGMRLLHQRVKTELESERST